MIGSAGEALGVMDTQRALDLAREQGYDLVEVSPKAAPPVVKIVDAGKLAYEKEKQLRKNKAVSKKNSSGEVKGIRLTMKISDHDMLVRVKAAQKFLDKGNKVKAELRMRGREKAHPELGHKTIQRFIDQLERDVQIEQPIKRNGGAFSALIAMKKK